MPPLLRCYYKRIDGPSRVTTQVNAHSFTTQHARYSDQLQSRGFAEYKEAFALFDKKGTGAVPRETLGDLLRALGQNPTQAEVADIVASAPREGTSVSTDFDGEVLITT